MANRWGKKWKQWQTLFSWAPNSLWMVTAAIKLKDTCSLEESESASHSVVSNFLRPHDYTVHGILQARILEWVAFPFSSGSSQPKDQSPALQADSLPTEVSGKPWKKKLWTNLDRVLKSRDITLPAKARIVKAMVFLVVICRCESWTIKKAGHQRIDAF